MIRDVNDFPTQRLQKAATFCVAAHGAMGQTRRYIGGAYHLHPFEVYSILARYTDDEDLLIAALLHDVLEDTRVTEDDIRAVFGDRVLSLIQQVSNISRPEDGNRATRKAKDRAHFAQASPEGQTLKLADILSNIRTIVERDPHFAKVYVAEKLALLPVLQSGNTELFSKVCALVVGQAGIIGLPIPDDLVA